MHASTLMMTLAVIAVLSTLTLYMVVHKNRERFAAADTYFLTVSDTSDLVEVENNKDVVWKNGKFLAAKVPYNAVPAVPAQPGPAVPAPTGSSDLLNWYGKPITTCDSGVTYYCTKTIGGKNYDFGHSCIFSALPAGTVQIDCATGQNINGLPKKDDATLAAACIKYWTNRAKFDSTKSQGWPHGYKYNTNRGDSDFMYDYHSGDHPCKGLLNDPTAVQALIDAHLKLFPLRAATAAEKAEIVDFIQGNQTITPKVPAFVFTDDYIKKDPSPSFTSLLPQYNITYWEQWKFDKAKQFNYAAFDPAYEAALQANLSATNTEGKKNSCIVDIDKYVIAQFDANIITKDDFNAAKFNALRTAGKLGNGCTGITWNQWYKDTYEAEFNKNRGLGYYYNMSDYFKTNINNCIRAVENMVTTKVAETWITSTYQLEPNWADLLAKRYLPDCTKLAYRAEYQEAYNIRFTTAGATQAGVVETCKTEIQSYVTGTVDTWIVKDYLLTQSNFNAWSSPNLNILTNPNGCKQLGWRSEMQTWYNEAFDKRCDACNTFIEKQVQAWQPFDSLTAPECKLCRKIPRIFGPGQPDGATPRVAMINGSQQLLVRDALAQLSKEHVTKFFKDGTVPIGWATSQ